LTSLVRRAAALAIDKELRRMAAARGQAMQGDHLARLLIDVMHDLVHSAATWVPNAEKSRVWHARDGTFVVWPGAYQDIAAYADRERLYGVPRDAQTMLAALDHAAAIERGQQDCIWRIRPPYAAGDVECLKLANPELAFAGQLATCQVLPPLCVQSADTSRPVANPQPNGPAASQAPAPEGEPAQMALALHDPPPLATAASEAAPPGELHAVSKASPMLTNCLRLPADVADVVRRALEGLDGGNTSAAAHVIREGVLLPLELFKAAHLDARFAMRSLRDAGMLVVGESGNPTYTAMVDGSELRGVVLKRRLVTGLPKAD
jgi:conjugal transfer pilus assembly protein TraI